MPLIAAADVFLSPIRRHVLVLTQYKLAQKQQVVLNYHNMVLVVWPRSGKIWSIFIRCF